MIVVDSSAVVAIFRNEGDAGLFAERIERDSSPVISAAGVLECSIVIRAFKELPEEEAETWLDGFLARAGFDVRPVTLIQLAAAREAHRRFGKGTGHGAGLNFGDCFAYALAKSLEVPLLFRGGDFARTDIASALA